MLEKAPIPHVVHKVYDLGKAILQNPKWLQVTSCSITDVAGCTMLD